MADIVRALIAVIVVTVPASAQTAASAEVEALQRMVFAIGLLARTDTPIEAGLKTRGRWRVPSLRRV
jgi:hypothetical protein